METDGAYVEFLKEIQKPEMIEIWNNEEDEKLEFGL